MLDSSFLQNFKVVKMLLLLNSKRHTPNNVMLLTREALLFRPVSLRIPSFSVPNKHQETINIEKGILTRINRNLRKKKELHPLFPLLHQTSVNRSKSFLSGSFTYTGNSQNCWEREGTILYSSLPLPPAHEHSYIYLQLYMPDDYLVFLIGSHIITRLLLD